MPRHHDGGALRNGRTNKNAAGLEVLAALNSTLATSCPLPIGIRVTLLPSCPHDTTGQHQGPHRLAIHGAEGGTRTPTGCPTRPSNVRVCQFRHFGASEG